jgi:hypothetical protein
VGGRRASKCRHHYRPAACLRPAERSRCAARTRAALPLPTDACVAGARLQASTNYSRALASDDRHRASATITYITLSQCLEPADRSAVHCVTHQHQQKKVDATQCKSLISEVNTLDPRDTPPRYPTKCSGSNTRNTETSAVRSVRGRVCRLELRPGPPGIARTPLVMCMQTRVKRYTEGVREEENKATVERVRRRKTLVINTHTCIYKDRH